ncbi:MAG: head GIN domain-containing protein [Bacteroidales bacterium]
MKKTSFLLLASLLGGATGCVYLGPCLDGSGPVIAEIRELHDFTEVHNEGSFDVIVERADSFTVEVEAQENLLPFIETHVSGSALVIRMQNGTCYRSLEHVRVHVRCPQLEQVQLSGSGTVEADVVFGDRPECINSGSGRVRVDSLAGTALYVKNSGSGEVVLGLSVADEAEIVQTGSGTIDGGTLEEVAYLSVSHSSSGRVSAIVPDAREVQANMSGSGRLVLEGFTQTGEYVLSSSGRIDALYLQAGEVTARNSGSGNIYLYAIDLLDALITGSGDVIYRGEPTVQFHVTGSGKVRPY